MSCSQIIPLGSCAKVIEVTKAYKCNSQLHKLNNLDVFGVIDRDYRSDDEVDALKEYGIYTLKVAEIENLLCIEPLLKIVAKHQGLDPKIIVEECKSFFVKKLESERDTQIQKRIIAEIKFKLNGYDIKNNLDSFSANLVKYLDKEIKIIEDNSSKLYDNAINNKNIETILKIYNRKSLIKEISTIFNLKLGEYYNLIERLCKNNDDIKIKNDIIDELKKELPDINHELI